MSGKARKTRGDGASFCIFLLVQTMLYSQGTRAHLSRIFVKHINPALHSYPETRIGVASVDPSLADYRISDLHTADWCL